MAEMVPENGTDITDLNDSVKLRATSRDIAKLRSARNTERFSIYENIECHYADETICIGILKALDRCDIFKDSTLCDFAGRHVCRMNDITIASPPTPIRKGSAVRIPIKSVNLDKPLLKSDFVFARSDCIFYIIDSRPQASEVGTLKRAQSRATDKESVQCVPSVTAVPENFEEDCMSVPTVSLWQFSECMRSWVKKQTENKTVLIVSLTSVLFIIILILIIIISTRPSQNDEMTTTDLFNEDAPEPNSEMSHTTVLNLKQLLEKQEKELNYPRLFCQVSFASKSVVDTIDPNDVIFDFANFTQRVSMAKCPSEAHCPTGYQCAPEVFAQKKIAVHLAHNLPGENKDYVEREVWEAASCSCQLIEDLENVIVDPDYDYAEENPIGNTSESVSNDTSVPNSSNHLVINQCLLIVLWLAYLKIWHSTHFLLNIDDGGMRTVN